MDWEKFESWALKATISCLVLGFVYANYHRIAGLDRIPKDHLRIKAEGSEIKIYGYSMDQIRDLKSPKGANVIFCLNCEPPGICVSAQDKRYYSFQGKPCWKQEEAKK